MTYMGVGAIAGSLMLAKLGSLKNKGYWVLITSVMWGLGVAAFAITTNFILAALVIGFVGLVSAINMSMNRSLVQLQVSQSMRGRVMSIDMMSHGLMPLGVLPISYLVDNVSIQVGLVTSGIILVVLTIVTGYLMPQIRAIDKGYLAEFNLKSQIFTLQHQRQTSQ